MLPAWPICGYRLSLVDTACVGTGNFFFFPVFAKYIFFAGIELHCWRESVATMTISPPPFCLKSCHRQLLLPAPPAPCLGLAIAPRLTYTDQKNSLLLPTCWIAMVLEQVRNDASIPVSEAVAAYKDDSRVSLHRDRVDPKLWSQKGLPYISWISPVPLSVNSCRLRA